MPCQFRPQKRLIRCASTIAFGNPISVWQKGWRTQLVSLTVSGSINVTCRPPDGRIPAWLGGGRGGRKRRRCRARRSRPPGYESAVRAVVDRECASSALGLQSLQVLVQRFLLNQRRNWEPPLPCHSFPERSRSASALC